MCLYTAWYIKCSLTHTSILYDPRAEIRSEEAQGTT